MGILTMWLIGWGITSVGTGLLFAWWARWMKKHTGRHAWAIIAVHAERPRRRP